MTWEFKGANTWMESNLQRLFPRSHTADDGGPWVLGALDFAMRRKFIDEHEIPPTGQKKSSRALRIRSAMDAVGSAFLHDVRYPVLVA